MKIRFNWRRCIWSASEADRRDGARMRVQAFSPPQAWKTLMPGTILPSPADEVNLVPLPGLGRAWRDPLGGDEKYDSPGGAVSGVRVRPMGTRRRAYAGLAPRRRRGNPLMPGRFTRPWQMKSI